MRRRRETLAARVLDPNVSQEVLKLTIAYKAGPNGVDKALASYGIAVRFSSR